MRGAATARAAPPPAPIRRPVAVLVSRFPLVTETFILREIDELERQGQPVVLVPLLRERPAVVHPEARRWTERALYTPYLSPAIAAANLRLLRRRPLRYLGTLLRLAGGMSPSPGFLLRSLLLYPKAAYLAERLPREGVEHLHAHFATHPATVAWVASRLAPLTFSFTAHAHDLFVDATFLGAKVRAARFVRTISRFNRRWLSERWPEAGARTAVVHMGVEPQRYRAAAGAGAGGTPDAAPPFVLCVAALKPYKGIPVLLAACELLHRRGVDVRCRIVGDGPQRRALQAEVRRRGLEGRVELLGPRTQDEVARLVARCRVVVLSSVVADDGQMEGLPVVLMEAAAAGRAMVAPELSGIPELVEHGVSGLLFPPGDAEALAQRLERLLADPEEARRLGRRARQRVEEGFRLDRTAAGLLALLDAESSTVPRRDSEPIRRLLGEAPAVGVEAVHEGPDSRVLELLVASPDGPRRRLLKTHRERRGQSAPPAVRAAREAGVLRRLEELRARGLPLGAPTVLAVDEGRGALLLEPAPGRPLDDLLRRWRRPVARRARHHLETAGRRCGGWLRSFQAEVPPPAGAEGDLEPASHPPVACHGDLWPGNLLLDAARVSVLDFEGIRGGGPWEDPARLLIHAELFFPPPLGGRFRRFEAGLLAGFGRPVEPALDACRRTEARRALETGSWRHGARWLAPWRRRLLTRRAGGRR